MIATFPAARERLQADLVAQPFVHPMLFVADQQRHGNEALVRRLADDVQIGMRAREHLHAGRAMFARIEQFRRPRLAKQRLSQLQSKLSLADAARPDE